MTCIAALVDKGNVYMGGERGYSDTHNILSSTQPKISTHGLYLFGYSGNSGVGQAVKYNFDFPAIKIANIDKHMGSVFIPALRSFFEDSKIALPPNEEDSAGFLVGIKGKVYEVDTFDFQCVEYEMVSIGSGSGYAMGSLYSTSHLPPVDRITTSINSAIEYSPSCLGPVDILIKSSTNPRQKDPSNIYKIKITNS